MPRKKKMEPLSLEQKVETWTKWIEFNHKGPTCEKCHQSTYLFNPDDNDGFCLACFLKRWPHSSHGPESKHHKKKTKTGMVVEAKEPQGQAQSQKHQGH